MREMRSSFLLLLLLSWDSCSLLTNKPTLVSALHTVSNRPSRHQEFPPLCWEDRGKQGAVKMGFTQLLPIILSVGFHLTWSGLAQRTKRPKCFPEHLKKIFIFKSASSRPDELKYTLWRKMSVGMLIINVPN